MMRCLGLMTVLAGMVSCSTILADDSTTSNKVYELRVYKTHPGKLDALNKRFRDHTCRLFEKHGMKCVAFWTPTDEPDASDTLIYILAHKDRASAAKSWASFRDDPEWHKVHKESEKDGPIVSTVKSTYMTPTSYSNFRQ